MKKNLINSHDKFFKELFSRKEEVSEFVSKTFPVELSQKLDLETLVLDKTEYVGSQLKTSFSDIVYNCNYGENTIVKISLLFEHKSYLEIHPYLQLLGYMLKIWETQIKQKQNLTPIIPIIFYHGIKKWVKKPFESYFSGLDVVLRKFTPIFDYQIIDTSNYSDKQIQQLFSSLELQIGMLILKNIFNEQLILKELNNFFAKISELLQSDKGEHFFESLVTYLYYATDIETQKFTEKMRTISPKAEEKFISTAMKLEMIGFELGIKKVAFSMLQENIPDSIILKVTKLSQKELDYLKSLKEYQIDLDKKIN